MKIKMNFMCILLSCAALTIVYGQIEGTDLDIVILRNETSFFLDQIEDGSIVVDTEPFDFIYEDASIILVNDSYVNQRIERRHFHNISDNVTIARYIYGVTGIQYDRRNGNIYWLQSNIIEVSDITGTYRHTLYWKDMDQINCMVIDSNVGYIFWSDGGTFPKIERASMHGDDSSRIVVAEDIYQPLGLAADAANSHLYWSDASKGLIERCTYQGEERMILMQILQLKPGHLTLFNGTLYWVEQLKQTLNAFLLLSNTTEEVAQLPTELLQRARKIYKEERLLNFKLQIYESRDKGVIDDGHGSAVTKTCDQLSLTQAGSSEVVCKCAAYYKMSEKSGCIKDEDNLTLVFSSNKYGISIVSGGSIENISDIVTKHIVFLDHERFIFTEKTEMYTSSLKNISAYQSSVNLPYVASTFDLVYDWLGGNLYWAINDVVNGYVFNLKLKPGNDVLTKIFFVYSRIVRYLALDVNNKLIFVVVDNHVIRLTMDGNISTLTKLLGFQTSYILDLSIDTSEEKVYVSVYYTHVYGFGKMYQCNYDGVVVKERYTQYTRKVAFTKNKIISIEIEDNQYFILNKCDKRFNGNCKTILRDKEDIYKTFRVHPEDRTYIGIHPCQNDNGNCTHFCLLTRYKPFYSCRCNHYYFLAPDKKTCVSHPCNVLNGNCSMDCYFLLGTDYRCGCSNGYWLDSDGKTCHGEMGFIFIEVVTQGWRQIDLSSNSYTTTHTFVGATVNDIDYDPIEQKIYWLSSAQTGKSSFIIKNNPNGKEREVVVLYDDISIQDFVLDWRTRYIYLMTGTDFRRTDWNITETLQLSFSEVFGTIFSFDIKENLRKHSLKFLHFEADIFNGYLYCALIQDHTYHFDFKDIYRLETIIFQSKVSNHRPMHILRFESWVKGSFIIDTLNNQVYYVAIHKILRKYTAYLYVCNTDGSGNTEVASNSLVSRPVLFGDGYIHFLETTTPKTKILKTIHRETFDTIKTEIINEKDFGLYLTIGANLLVANTSKRVEECKDYQKCWSSVNTWICLTTQQICDGVNNCYNGFDEHYCSVCTQNCTIVSFKMFCHQELFHDTVNKSELSNFLIWEERPISNLVTLDNLISHDCLIRIEMKSFTKRHIQDMEISSLYRLHKLRQAILSPLFSNLSDVLDVDLTGEPLLIAVNPGGVGIYKNARVLQIRRSLISYLPEGTFKTTSKLESLTLSENRMLKRIAEGCFSGLNELQNLSITGSVLFEIQGRLFAHLGNLTFLNISSNFIQTLGEGVFNELDQLVILDMRRNEIKLTSELFIKTNVLQTIYCDSFTICCIKPPSVKDGHCTATKDDISSCNNLIENRILAAFLWIFGIMAFCGNFAVVIYRGVIDKSIFAKSYFIFVYNLSISDGIMSIYMIIIAWHDAIYDGVYVWNDYPWRRSILCRLSGMLSMVSSEASMMFVTLLTIERFICVKFAFGTVKLSRKAAVFVAIFVWFLASSLSIIPTISYPEFYSRSGVCIGIPLTQDNDTGLGYSTFVFLGFNFILCAVIPFGQHYILKEVKKSSEMVQSTQKGRNVTVAKRLAVVVISDCLCWLPIGILVILSLAGIKTSREVYAWVIIFVLPVNAAVNPYLYTLSDVKWYKVKQCFTRKRNGKRMQTFGSISSRVTRHSDIG